MTTLTLAFGFLPLASDLRSAFFALLDSFSLSVALALAFSVAVSGVSGKVLLAPGVLIVPVAFALPPSLELTTTLTLPCLTTSCLAWLPDDDAVGAVVSFGLGHGP